MTVEDQTAFFSTLNPDLTQRFLARDRLSSVSDVASGSESATQVAVSGATVQPESGDCDVLGNVAAPMSGLNVATLILLHRSLRAGMLCPQP